MKTVVDMIRDTKESIEEMEGQLSDLSALELKYQREIDMVREERKNLELNIELYKNIANSLTAMKNGELNKAGLEVKGEEKQEPMEDKNEEEKTIEVAWQVTVNGKRVVVLDEHDEKIAEYSTQHEAAKDLGISQGTISYTMRNVSKEKQLEKYGYVLVYG